MLQGPAPHGLRSCSSRPSKSAAAAGALPKQQHIPIFDRKMESALLERRLQEQPTSVLVLVGPRSCGKTTLLNQVCCLAANFLAYSGAQFGVEIPINLLFVRYLF